MTLLSPQELSLPPKFKDWRRGQEEAIETVLSSKNRFVVLCLPTGSGKAITAFTIHLLTGLRAVYLTSTKGLQDQYETDFAANGLVDLRGMSNYECLAVSQPGGEFNRFYKAWKQEKGTKPGCEEGPCRSGFFCSLRTKGCLYFDAVKRARESQSVVTNPALWFHTRENQSGGDSKLGDFGLLVADEAHSVDKHLSSHLQTRITNFEMVQFLSRQFPKGPPASWADWAKEHLRKVRDRIDILKSMGPPLSRVREMRFLTDLEGKFLRISNTTPDWVYESDGQGGGVWEPIWVAPYAEEYLFAGIKKVILTSATVRRKTVEMLGIKPEQYTFYEAKSSFPVKNRPVVHVETVRLSAKSSQQDLDTVVERVDQICRLWPDSKGIIGTVSYARSLLIKEKSEHVSRMLFPDAKNIRTIVDDWYSTPSNRILVSPSLTTGWDFPRLHGFIIVLKLAFPDPRGAVAKQRQKQDPDWGIYTAIQDLVQASGRMVRSKEDTCVTYVLDDTIATPWIRRKLKEFAPSYWVDAFSSSRVIPKLGKDTR